MTDSVADFLRKAGKNLSKAADLLDNPVTPKPPHEMRVLTAAAEQNPWRANALVYGDIIAVSGPLDGYHGYESGVPSGGWQDHINASVMEVHPAPNNMANIKTWDTEQYINFYRSCPEGTYLLCHHEPDNPSKDIDPAFYRRKYREFYEAVLDGRAKGTLSKNVYVCQNPMSWTFKSASGRDPDDWVAVMPDGSLAADILLVNGYDSGPNSGTAEAVDIFGPFLEWKDDNLPAGTAWGVGEWGCHVIEHVGVPNGAGVPYEGSYRTDEYEWTLRSLQWFHTWGAAVVVWFHSPVGPEGPWYMNHNIMRAHGDWMTP